MRVVKSGEHRASEDVVGKVAVRARLETEAVPHRLKVLLERPHEQQCVVGEIDPGVHLRVGAAGVHRLHPAIHEDVVVDVQRASEKPENHVVRGVDERAVVHGEVQVRVVQVEDAALLGVGVGVGEVRSSEALGSDRIHLRGLHAFRLSLLGLVVAGIVGNRVAAVEDDSVEQHVRVAVLKVVVVLADVHLKLDGRRLGAAVGLRSRLNHRAVVQDITLGEILAEAAVDVDRLADEDVPAAEKPVVVARRHIDGGTRRGDVQSLLDVLHRG